MARLLEEGSYQELRGKVAFCSQITPGNRAIDSINCAFIRLQIAFGRTVMKEQGIAVPKYNAAEKG